jgi:hypothetical protein
VDEAVRHRNAVTRGEPCTGRAGVTGRAKTNAQHARLGGSGVAMAKAVGIVAQRRVWPKKWTVANGGLPHAEFGGDALRVHDHPKGELLRCIENMFSVNS